MLLEDVLFSQGFGTRRVCAGLIQQGHVDLGGTLAAPADWSRCDDTHTDLDPEGLRFRVQGLEWRYQAKAYVMLYKPTGTECSQKPSTYPSVYTLLPAPLRQRPVKGTAPGIQAVGRLDQDTTGLLLMSDDGQFIHRMSSPKKHVPKLYQVTTRHPVDAAQAERLCAGVVLDDDPKPVRAAACVATGSHSLDLTLTEGKYHQVKRMIAAVGNRVEELHRARIGGLDLGDLQPGQWRWLDVDDLARITAAA